jgi:hypothetical protein
MNRIIKYLIIIFVTLIVIVSFIYIDYFNAKTNNTNPKISIKIESENDILYKAFFYKVYYCKTNKKYKIAFYDEEAVCPNNYNYVDGYYTNREGLKISKKDLQLLTNDGTYTSEMIENMKNDKSVSNAVLVANDFGSKKYKIIDEKDGYNVVIFPTFKEVDDNYDWIYDENDKKYCLKGENYNYQLASFDNNKCGKYERISMSEEWCKLYNQSTLVYLKGIENLCK